MPPRYKTLQNMCDMYKGNNINDKLTKPNDT